MQSLRTEAALLFHSPVTNYTLSHYFQTATTQYRLGPDLYPFSVSDSLQYHGHHSHHILFLPSLGSVFLARCRPYINHIRPGP